ncbi:MarR family winged helix-turn-helix transcriptional regulator [Rahnella perminowiae]|uniref:MarR family winged helix-turn-helix transcriptional regulator n=1 Tax=Rahnella perminowiae TaxID=2816244 RepID=UPI00215B83BD|nr:MarR family transcriptional regulator [Rahnella perminowiae]MCR9001768.1 MarR family transcriptional regulator [Rahnella perminowiae]
MKNMQNTHKTTNYEDLHDALLTIVGTFNRPQRDELMIKGSGVHLDRALFPLLVLISRFGPIGVVELADRVGRDYTTVSRQVAKLEETGLAQRQKNAKDKRINEAAITTAGKAMTDKIDVTRMQIYDDVFRQWHADERTELERLLKKFIADFTELERNKKSG